MKHYVALDEQQVTDDVFARMQKAKPDRPEKGG
jgi:hypothetical protein